MTSVRVMILSRRCYIAVLGSIVMASVCFGIYLRLTNLGLNEPGYDEAMEISVALTTDASTIVKALDIYSPPSLSPLLFHYFVKAFNPSTLLGLRTFSFLIGLATLLVTFFLGARATSLACASAAVIFVSLSPLLIEWNRIVRMYALAGLLDLVLVVAYLGALRFPKRKWWMVLCYLSALLIPQCSLPSVLLPVGVGIHYFLFARKDYETNRIFPVVFTVVLLSSLSFAVLLKMSFVQSNAFTPIPYLGFFYLNIDMPYGRMFQHILNLVTRETGLVLLVLASTAFLKISRTSRVIRDLLAIVVVINIVAATFTSIPFGHVRMCIFYAPLFAFLAGSLIADEYEGVRFHSSKALLLLVFIGLHAAAVTRLTANKTQNPTVRATNGMVFDRLAMVKDPQASDAIIYLIYPGLTVIEFSQKFKIGSVPQGIEFKSKSCGLGKISKCVKDGPDEFWVLAPNWYKNQDPKLTEMRKEPINNMFTLYHYRRKPVEVSH